MLNDAVIATHPENGQQHRVQPVPVRSGTNQFDACA